MEASKGPRAADRSSPSMAYCCRVTRPISFTCGAWDAWRMSFVSRANWLHSLSAAMKPPHLERPREEGQQRLLGENDVHLQRCLQGPPRLRATLSYLAAADMRSAFMRKTALRPWPSPCGRAGLGA